jgi:hypothetical protein
MVSRRQLQAVARADICNVQANQRMHAIYPHVQFFASKVTTNWDV